MTTCDHVARTASDYLEGKLGLRGRFAVWTHLLVCSACKAYVAQIRLAREALGALRAPAPKAGQVDSVMEAFRRERGKHSSDS